MRAKTCLHGTGATLVASESIWKHSKSEAAKKGDSPVIQSGGQLGTGAKRMAGEDVRDACRKERLGGTKSPGAKNLARWQESGA